MRITSKGQVTIPKPLRDKFGFGPEADVEFIPEGNALRLVRSGKAKHGRKLVGRMRGQADTQMTTDEILALTRQ